MPLDQHPTVPTPEVAHQSSTRSSSSGSSRAGNSRCSSSRGSGWWTQRTVPSRQTRPPVALATSVIQLTCAAAAAVIRACVSYGACPATRSSSPLERQDEHRLTVAGTTRVPKPAAAPEALGAVLDRHEGRLQGGPSLLSQLGGQQLYGPPADALPLTGGVDHEADQVRRPAVGLDEQDADRLVVPVDGTQKRARFVLTLGDGVRGRGDEMALALGQPQVADGSHVLA